MSKDTNKPEWEEWEVRFSKYYGAMFECGDFEQLMEDIRQVELEAYERGYQKWRLELRQTPVSPGVWNGVISTLSSQANYESQKLYPSQNSEFLAKVRDWLERKLLYDFSETNDQQPRETE